MSRLLRALVGAALVAGLAVLGVLAGGAPAVACSCASEPLRAEVDRADAIFTGTARDSWDVGGQVVVEVEVEAVFKGEVRERTDVVTSDQESACGATLTGPVLVFGASIDGGGVSTSSCSGSGAGRGQLVRLLGEGSPPADGESVADVRPDTLVERVPAWWPLVAAPVLVVAVVLLVTRRRRPT